MIVLVYLIVLLRELLVSTTFYTCQTYFFCFASKNAFTRMRTLTPRLVCMKVKGHMSFSCFLGR